ncbi:MAG: HAMP domain-containing protein [Planctomycetes bacterium]|nr:HAMP domain-containing protein [Planctomycetota bacterium]
MIRMSLQTRIAAIVAFIAVAFAVAGYAINRRFFYEQFVVIERKAAVDDLRRCEDAVKREMHHLAVWCGDWAAWDAAYSFVEGANNAFAAENITEESMKNTRCNALWFVRADGQIVAQKTLDLTGTENLTFPEVAVDRFPSGHPLLSKQSLDRGVSGIVRTARGPLLVASRPIIHSDFTGPIAGWFVCGRLLDASAVSALAEQTHVHFDVWDVDAADIPAEAQEAVRVATAPGDARIDDTSGETLRVSGTMNDVFGRTALVIHAEVPREISQQGAQSMEIATTSTAVAGIATVAVLLALLSFTVVSPLRRLTEHAARIGRDADLSARSGIVRNDEIGALAMEFDGMVAKLAESRNLLTETARRAGMADIARGVMHNIGNVLTSANVSAVNISSALKQSRSDGLVKGLDLVSERRADLAQFLAVDPCGKILPEYLAKAASALRSERAEMIAEAEKLRAAIAHAADIIARQSEFDSAGSAAETLPLAAALTGAAALVEPAFRRHSVVLATHADRDVSITVDRTKLTQILVNLLTNAKEALATREVSQRRVNLRAHVMGDRLILRVEDNGAGLTQDQVARAFERGFSTKHNGRGYGLHYCAVAAGELGGRLTMSSDGPGLGAVLTLDLPVAQGASHPQSSSPSSAPSATSVGSQA